MQFLFYWNWIGLILLDLRSSSFFVCAALCLLYVFFFLLFKNKFFVFVLLFFARRRWTHEYDLLCYASFRHEEIGFWSARMTNLWPQADTFRFACHVFACVAYVTRACVMSEEENFEAHSRRYYVQHHSLSMLVFTSFGTNSLLECIFREVSLSLVPKWHRWIS